MIFSGKTTQNLDQERMEYDPWGGACLSDQVYLDYKVSKNRQNLLKQWNFVLNKAFLGP